MVLFVTFETHSGHGDWDEVVDAVKQVSIKDAFDAFRQLFTVIAEARIAALPDESDDIPF